MDQMARPKGAVYRSADGSFHTFDSRLITETKPDFIAYSSLENTPRENVKGKTGLGPEAEAAGREYVQFMDALTKDYQQGEPIGQPGDMVEDMQYIQPVIYLWKRKPTP